MKKCLLCTARKRGTLPRPRTNDDLKQVKSYPLCGECFFDMASKLYAGHEWR